MNNITKRTVGAIAALCLVTSINSFASTSGSIKLFGIVRDKTSISGINSETTVSVTNATTTISNLSVVSNSDSSTNKLTVLPGVENPAYTILVNGSGNSSEIQTGTVQLAVALNPVLSAQAPAFDDKWTVQLANL